MWWLDAGSATTNPYLIRWKREWYDFFFSNRSGVFAFPSRGEKVEKRGSRGNLATLVRNLCFPSLGSNIYWSKDGFRGGEKIG